MIVLIVLAAVFTLALAATTIAGMSLILEHNESSYVRQLHVKALELIYGFSLLPPYSNQ
jgi:hypothetical protein